MSRDQEIKLGQIDEVVVDDNPGHRSAAPASQARPQARPAGSTSRKPSPGSQPIVAGGNHGWLYATLALAVVVLVLGAYFFRQVSTMQARLDNQFGQSSEELEKIASQLSATDESLNQSSGKVSETLALHGDEIRKLWDVSNKRNKEWIQKNQADIDKLEKQRAEINKSLAALQADMTALKTQNQQYVMQRNQMQTQLDLASESVKQAEAKVAAQKKVIDQFSGMLPSLKALAAAQAQGGGLDLRLTDVEAALTASDSYRTQVNSRLDRIEATPR